MFAIRITTAVFRVYAVHLHVHSCTAVQCHYGRTMVGFKKYKIYLCTK